MSDEDLRENLAHLPKVPEKPSPGMRAETLVIDKVLIASRLMHLQRCGLILYTFDFNPSRDFFQEWALDCIGSCVNIQIE